MIVICGDRHYQYVIEDAETGLREYATGPASDAHARGWRSDDVRPEHRYLNVIGGFVAVTTERLDGAPTLTVRHHDVDGSVLNEDVRARRLATDPSPIHSDVEAYQAPAALRRSEPRRPGRPPDSCSPILVIASTTISAIVARI